MMWAQELVILLAAGCLMLAWWRGRPMKGAWVLECRSADGETVGLIDAAIHVMRAASRGDLTSVAAQERRWLTWLPIPRCKPYSPPRRNPYRRGRQ